jgi:hypothetical protein
MFTGLAFTKCQVSEYAKGGLDMGRRKPLRWRREPDEPGLARIGQPPRGAELRIGNEVLASVCAARAERWSRSYIGWYWVAISDKYGVPLHNSCRKPVSDIEEAKVQAHGYVLQHIKREDEDGKATQGNAAATPAGSRTQTGTQTADTD